MGAQQSTPSAPTIVPPATGNTAVPVSACPVKHDTTAPAPAAAAPVSACPVKHDGAAAASVSACPVSHKSADSGSACPVRQKPSATTAAKDCGCEKKADATPATPAAEECPVQTKTKYQNPKVYNVYSQEIDPKNMMPTTANQQPAPGQNVTLPVDREASSIPKGGTESTWQYPSPQMVSPCHLFILSE